MNKIHPKQNTIDSQAIYKDLSDRIKDKIQELSDDDSYFLFGKLISHNDHLSKYILFVIVYNFVVFIIIAILIYMIYQQWVDWGDLEKINNTQCPYGFVYILISLPILFIQGYDYESESQNEKEINLLLEDLKYFRNLNFNQQQNLREREIFAFHKKYKFQIQKFIIYPLLLLIIFFSDGFYSAINSFVVLTFISQSQKGMVYYIQKSMISQTNKKDMEEFYNLNSEADNSYNDDKQMQLFNSVVQKLKKISHKYVFEKGNQHALIFQNNLNLIFYFRMVLTMIYSLLYAFSIYNYWISENQDNYSQLFASKLIYIVTFYINPSNDFVQVQEYDQFMLYLQYLNKYDSDYQFVRYKDIQIPENLIISSTLLAQKYTMKLCGFLLLIFTYQFQELYDFIINLYALEYILKLDQGMIDSLYIWFSREMIRKLSQLSIFQYPQELKYKTFDQYYCYYLELNFNQDDFKEEEISNEDLKSLIMKELNETYDQLFFEDGFQLVYLEPFRCKVIRWLVFIIVEACYCSLMLLDKIQKWYDLSYDDVYINGECPWGVVYIAISLLIIFSQGIGSEENPLLKRYMLLRKHYIEINQNQQPKFNWNDQIPYDLHQFKKIQRYFLIAVLLILIFFQQYYYEVIVNILQLEFLSNLDDHLIGKYFRYRYRYQHLSENWNKLEKIEKIQNQTLENIYRYVWGLNQIDHQQPRFDSQINTSNRGINLLTL